MANKPTAFDSNAAAPRGSGIFGLPFAPEESRIVLIPVPFEATTSYGGGTARGPRAILQASRQVDLYDHETGKPYEAGIAMLRESSLIKKLNAEGKRAAKPVIAAGGAHDRKLMKSAEAVNAACEKMNTFVKSETKKWLAKGKLVGVVGGDHSTPFGAIEAHAEQYKNLGILHFDAHADLREAYEGFAWSHASILQNVAARIPKITKIVQVGVRDYCEEEAARIRDSNGRIETFFMPDLYQRKFAGAPWSSIAHEIAARLPENVYITFDIDGLDQPLCPHTGTPVPGGLQFYEATAVISAVARSGRKIVGFDLNEVAPGPRGDEWDANVGARMLYKLIGYAAMSQD
ncbi:MAG: agmatinase family protein [Planctomycetes bacterium]|nr:agmatinase family protein [Planctomycetota bacterium]